MSYRQNLSVSIAFFYYGTISKNVMTEKWNKALYLVFLNDYFKNKDGKNQSWSSDTNTLHYKIFRI